MSRQKIQCARDNPGLPTDGLSLPESCSPDQGSRSQLVAEDSAVAALQSVAEPHPLGGCAHAARSRHLVHGCASAVLPVQRVFCRSSINPSKPLTAALPLPFNDDSSKPMIALEAMAVDGPDLHVAAWLTQDYSEVALTAGARTI